MSFATRQDYREGVNDWRMERIAHLEEQVAYLQGELGLVFEARRVDAIMRAFGLTFAQARILLCLARARGKVMSIWAIHAAALGRDDADGSANVVSVHISKLQKIAGSKLIRNSWSNGFALTPEGLARVKEALGE